MLADPHEKVRDWPQLSDKPLIGAPIPRIVAGNKDTENNRGVAVSGAERPKRRIVASVVWHNRAANALAHIL